MGPLRAAERIRQTARELFYRHGIRAVGVDAIVQSAGVTKPSLYRAFESKDSLAAAYLADYDAMFWARFDEAAALHPGDAQGQVLEFMRGLGKRASTCNYRGCGLSNAAVEYPEAEHPARKVAEGSKRLLRQRLHALAEAMGAVDPALLGDGLQLLIEGAYLSGQIFGEGGPAVRLEEVAAGLIAANLPACTPPTPNPAGEADRQD